MKPTLAELSDVLEWHNREPRKSRPEEARDKERANAILSRMPAECIVRLAVMNSDTRWRLRSLASSHAMGYYQVDTARETFSARIAEILSVAAELEAWCSLPTRVVVSCVSWGGDAYALEPRETLEQRVRNGERYTPPTTPRAYAPVVGSNEPWCDPDWTQGD